MYPLLWLSLAFLAGLLLANRFILPWTTWAGLAFACLLASLLERRLLRRIRPHSRLLLLPVPLALLAAALLGAAARYQATRPVISPASLAWYNGQGEFLLRGWVARPPETLDASTRLVLLVEELQPLAGDQPAGESLRASGLLRATLPPDRRWRYGDRLELRGRLETPPEGVDFSYREALARQGVYSWLSGYNPPRLLGRGAGSPVLALLYGLRARAYQVVNTIFPQPEAALLSGILLGLDQDLPEALSEAYKITGTAHIIAISGFNISVLAALFAGLFSHFLTRWWAALAAVLSILAYALLVGGEPAVTRAAIMGGLALYGRELGRKSAGLNSLAFSAAVMSAFKPDLPWDASFQLSFAATLGLVLYAGPLQVGFQRLASGWLGAGPAKKLAGPVGEYLLFTLAAQITTLPIMITQFGRVSLVALLANPLVLPAQPLVMILGGLAVIAGLVWLPPGQVLGWAAWPFAAYTNRLVSLLARIPGGSLEWRVSDTGWLLLFYGALLGLTLAGRTGRLRVVLKPGLALGTAGLAAVLAWQGALSLPDGRLQLEAANMDGSQVILARTPGRRSLLVDSALPARLEEMLGERLPLFSRDLDGWVLARPVNAPGEGLASLAQRFHLGWAAAPDGVWAGKNGEALEKGLFAAGRARAALVPGLFVDLGQGARLETLAVSQQGAALLLEWGRFRALLPGSFAAAELQPYAARLDGLSLIILDEGNLLEGLEGWQSFHPLSIWIGAKQDPGELPGRATWVQPGGWARVITDGERMWLEVGK